MIALELHFVVIVARLHTSFPVFMSICYFISKLSGLVLVLRATLIVQIPINTEIRLVAALANAQAGSIVLQDAIMLSLHSAAHCEVRASHSD
jgi:ABC-type protease/lipase transport system fused ATPase/permease subunit